MPAGTEVPVGTGETVAVGFQARTTIDPDGSHQATARDVFGKAGIDHGHARLINGAPAEVLPRLADGAYDAVILNQLDGSPEEFIVQALRLLRVGGALVIAGFLGSDAIALDLSARDEHTNALRALGDAVRTNEELVSVLLPMSDGLLIAIKKL
ncbi:MAG: hypothetical protein HQ526_02995 [Actinobacteria bacterium]|nr:hypothetical protein [Actinomycetota bacterium]